MARPRPPRVRHPRVRGLVQPPPASRTHRRHPTGRKGGQLPSRAHPSTTSWSQVKRSPGNPVRFNPPPPSINHQATGGSLQHQGNRPRSSPPQQNKGRFTRPRPRTRVLHIWARYLPYRPVWVSDDVGDDPLEFGCLGEARLVRLGWAGRTVWGLLRRWVIGW